MDFRSEAHLCEEFIRTIPDEWTVYPESCGFDMLLSHNATGHQVGIEAKLRLNAKVLVQALPSPTHPNMGGPDFRAILVPWGRDNDIATLAKHMDITVLKIKPETGYKFEGLKTIEYIRGYYSWPDLPTFIKPNPHTMEKTPTWRQVPDWVDWCPVNRSTLPEVVPDVSCGVAAPLRLTVWKISAIKLLIVLDKFGTVTRQDFKDLAISPSIWTSSRWLQPAEQRGHWKRCDKTPDLKKEHPINFSEIEAMIDNWMPENRKGIQNG